MQEDKQPKSQQLDQTTYDIITGRLNKQKQDLQHRVIELNAARKEVFGSMDTRLIGNDRVDTEVNCIARDIISLDGKTCLFGYNVHFGLRTTTQVSDVFGVYDFERDDEGGRFRRSATGLQLLADPTFESDFQNLYKYYRNTIFAKFAMQGNYLHMVFQLSDAVTDIKTFKWLVDDGQLRYIDNRSEHEYAYPSQYSFNWSEAGRDDQRTGVHAHVSILDKVFVETIGGDLTIKIEDNTDDGLGIYNEPVEHRDQTLDDGRFKYASLGNLIVLEIKPFQEESRYFVYNEKMQAVESIPSIQQAAIALPDDQGLIFPSGYYLQTGQFNKFPITHAGLKFQKSIASPNGEDHLYVFYNPVNGEQVLMAYNVIDQTMQTPIVCNGFALMQGGELAYFRTEEEQTKHHLVQIWQTPFITGEVLPSEHSDKLLYKIGNKDIVKAMAQSNELITLLNKEDSYQNLYDDIADLSHDILATYYWLEEEETKQLAQPLQEINKAANTAIDEFEKVKSLRREASQQIQETEKVAQQLFSKVKSASLSSIQEFVDLLTELNKLRGKAIGLKSIRFVDLSFIENLEKQIEESTEKISQRAVEFLLRDDALAPYHDAVQEENKALEDAVKVVELKALETRVDQISVDLELLISTVSNLEIEDTAHSTEIIERISSIFSSLNQLRAGIKSKRTSLGTAEAAAGFAAQLKLIDQSVLNYLELAQTPDKCDEYLTKLSIELEELEARYTEYDEYVNAVIEKREEIYLAFESRKNRLREAQSKKIESLASAATRIITGITRKAGRFEDSDAVNGFYASDLMVNKVRDIVDQLTELDAQARAQSITTALMTSREDALRQLKDRQDLYTDGNSVIKLGKHRFGVNTEAIDVTLVERDGKLLYHITGTNFYQELDDPILNESREFWDQELVSENDAVYRAEYLAYTVFQSLVGSNNLDLSPEQLEQRVVAQASSNYQDGYVKGVHDQDAIKILGVLLNKHKALGVLRYRTELRAATHLAWSTADQAVRDRLLLEIKATANIQALFPATTDLAACYEDIVEQLDDCTTDRAAYLFEELKTDPHFTYSHTAIELATQFKQHLKSNKAQDAFTSSLDAQDALRDKVMVCKQWLHAFAKSKGVAPKRDTNTSKGALASMELPAYALEAATYLQLHHGEPQNEIFIEPIAKVSGLSGSHPVIEEGNYHFDYHHFLDKLDAFTSIQVDGFKAYRKARHETLETLRESVRLSEFKPQVLTSFVRNKLIDQVYLPLIGDNLAKQLGTVGENTRTDRMGALLLVSPPGYGKTTLMEYIAQRLGLVFMKINGPSIGHEVTSVDPAAATNAAARRELEKLNLAFEMGDNVMLYLDDIQHCNPEFLQKFISLADGTRKVEGVFQGEPKTYDLRGSKFCLIMAGNPYTETGDKFQIPDMLANRADIYNLGDIIGDTAALFELSLIENALTSNPVLQQLASRSYEDIYTLINRVQGSESTTELVGNHSSQELSEYESVLDKLLRVRDTIVKVNQAYIASAAMEDAYRTEPSFKLQGSYRDMNKLAARLVPIMDDEELTSLLQSHYDNESQTLTSAAEANLLKYKEMVGSLSPIEQERWETIKASFVKNNKLKGLGTDRAMGQIIQQMEAFSSNLEGIKNVLQRNPKQE